MRKTALLVLVISFVVGFSAARGWADDLAGTVRNAVEKSTLDQAGTRPFHSKATYAPSFERDKGSNHVGEVEIWWESPTKWRREVRSPGFHQIAIVDGAKQWQKNEGDYFPEWLRELVVAIIRPVPVPMDVLLQRVKTGEVRRIAAQTNINWDAMKGSEGEQINGKGYLALMNQTGLLFYTGGPGWGGLYKDFRDFHGRMVAYTVAAGSPEVTAKISVLEDLGSVPSNFFDTATAGGDPLLDTVVLSDAELRRNLLPGKPFVWPALKDGPLEGMTGTDVTLDRSGKIREIDKAISDNPGVNQAAEEGFGAMQFQPFMRNGVPVQATGRLLAHFKTVRPEGVENFESAGAYFERGRKASCLGAGATAPYTLHAEFRAASAHGAVETGRYEDTWMSLTEWRREAWFGSSHLLRSQDGEKHYMLSDGPEVGLLRLVMMIVEPIPATDTMTESDWRIRRDPVNGKNLIRVFRGPEGPNGELDTKSSQGYWFDDSNQLIKTYSTGFEVIASGVEAYAGVQVARRIEVIKDGNLGVEFVVKTIGPPTAATSFKLKGHEGERSFTSEVR